MNHFIAALVFMCMLGIASKVGADADHEVDKFLEKQSLSDDDVDELLAASENYREAEIEKAIESRRKQSNELKADALANARPQKVEDMLMLKESLTDCSMNAFMLFEKTYHKWSKDSGRHGWSMAGVKQLARRHADYCLDKIVDLKNKHLAELDPEDVSRVREFTRISDKRVEVDGLKVVHGKIVDEEFSFDPNSDFVDEMTDSVLRQYNNNPDQRGAEKPSGEKMFDSYIKGPCERYLSQLSDDFTEWFLSSIRASDVQFSPKYEEMEKDYRGYRICSFVINDTEKTFNGIVKRLNGH